MVNKQAQEVHGVLWWRRMRYNKGVVLKVELWSNIALDRQNHLNFKQTNIKIVFLLQGDVLLSYMFFAAEKNRSSSREMSIQLRQCHWYHEKKNNYWNKHYIVLRNIILYASTIEKNKSVNFFAGTPENIWWLLLCLRWIEHMYSVILFFCFCFINIVFFL